MHASSPGLRYAHPPSQCASSASARSADSQRSTVAWISCLQVDVARDASVCTTHHLSSLICTLERLLSSCSTPGHPQTKATTPPAPARALEAHLGCFLLHILTVHSESMPAALCLQVIVANTLRPWNDPGALFHRISRPF